MKKIFVPKYFPFYTAVLTILVYLFILFFSNILGWGNSTILSGDLYQQHIAFIQLFLDMLKGNGNFWYSFSLFYGNPTAATYAYYCLSPFNLLYLIPGISIPAMTIVLTVAKHALAASAFQIFCRKGLKCESPISILYGTAYACCAFAVTMQMHIMWLDALYLLPFIVLFILFFVNGRSGLPLVPLYALLFLTNFYMGYIVGIFSGLCFVALLILKSNKSTIKKAFFKCFAFAGYVLLAVGCCAVILFPAAAELIGQRGGDTEGFRIVAINIADVINNLFLGQMQSMGSPIPLLYCSLPVFIILPLYFISKNIEKKEKLLSASILFFYLLSTQIDILYKFIHAFEAPGWFAHRYAFCCVFLILALCCRATNEIKTVKIKPLIIYIGCLLLFYSIMIPLQNLYLPGYQNGSHGWLIIISLFFAAYVAGIYCYISEIHIKLLPTLFTILLCSELIINACTDISRNYFGYTYESEYNERNTTDRRIYKEILHNDPNLYRIRTSGENIANSSAWYHYPGLSSFDSIDPIRLRSFLGNMGVAAPFECIYDVGHTPITDMILGTRYNIILPHTYNNEDLIIEGNPLALPIGFMTGPKPLEYVSSSDPFTNQENLINALCNNTYKFFSTVSINDIVITPANEDILYYDELIAIQHQSDIITNGKVTFSSIIPDKHDLYAWFPTNGNICLDSTSPTINGTANPFQTPAHASLQHVVKGLPSEGGSSEISIVFDNTTDYAFSDFYFVIFDPSDLPKAYKEITQYPLKISSWKDGYVYGTVTATEQMPVLFTTIPYDKGWNITVDGKPSISGAAADKTFLCTALEPGTHTVEFQYIAPLSGAGMFTTAICLIVFLLLLMRYYKKANLTQDKESNKVTNNEET